MKKVSNEEGQNPLVYLLSKTWQYSKGNQNNIVLFWSLFIVGNSITLFAQPLLWAKIMNVITTQGISTQSIKTLIWLLLMTLLADIVFWSLHGPGRLLERANAFKSRANYRKHLLKGMMTLPMEWHRDHHSGDTIDKIEKGTSALYGFSEDSFEIISAIVQLVGSYGMLIYFSPPSAYIVLTMMFVTVWITVRFDRILIGQYKKLNRAENGVSEKVFDTISNIATVITLRVERLVFKAIVHKIEEPFELFKDSNIVNELKWFFTNICCTVTTIVVLGIYFWQHVGSGHGILVGSVYLLIEYLSRISSLFFKFTAKYGEILQQKAKVINSEELANDFIAENFINHVLPKNWQKLQLQGLNFSYEEECGSLHLEDISMSILKGQRIAFIGETGSGKTTFLRVIRDLYHPKSLMLTVDGKIIPCGFEGISQAISLVPQNPEIFATTIIENITLGAEYDPEFVRHFTDIACFTEVAEGLLPNQFNTSIKEKGVNLSGGQQQRLALARGLLACHDKDIVLLDEPTSSLDTSTEMDVYQNIFKEFKDKTVISTIHRMHLLPLFDMIYLFDKGKIIGSGTLSELLSSNFQFQKLWQKSVAFSE